MCIAGASVRSPCYLMVLNINLSSKTCQIMCVSYLSRLSEIGEISHLTSLCFCFFNCAVNDTVGVISFLSLVILVIEIYDSICCMRLGGEKTP